VHRRDATEADLRLALAVLYETLLRVITGSLMSEGRSLRLRMQQPGARGQATLSIRVRKRRVRAALRPGHSPPGRS